MRKHVHASIAAAAVVLLVSAAVPAIADHDPDHELDVKSRPAPAELGVPPGQADHRDFPSMRNMHALGQSPHPAAFEVPIAEREISSDLAFWGKLAIQGNYDGFRVIDISSPAKPKLISHPRCNGDQGDVVVWENIVVRSWNSPAPEGRLCMGEEVPVGFEGVHVFDISDPANPELLTAVEFSAVGAEERGTADGCGSHTSTLVPDLDNNRLIVYSNNSSGDNRPVCDAMDIIEVPIDDPAAASHIGYVPLMDGTLGTNNGCHDAGVILGDVNMLTCASGHAANVFSIGEPGGGTLEEPLWLFNIEEEDPESGVKVGTPGVGRWHSAAFTFDGEVIILGWEPGGGGQARCTADDPDINKSLFFYSAEDGSKLGQWVLENPQGHDENCTIHNYNVVPLRSGDYVLASGHYQAGSWIVDFTGIQEGVEPESVAWADPPSLGPGPFCTTTWDGEDTPTDGCRLGGSWSSYWYNGTFYESDITRGLNIYKVSDRALAGAIRLPHLNPQTQEFTLR
ncbi:hypothetical protein [Phytoactinopolyspora mesophila]|uniref:Choice-of-anchor B family protein n=1 Tax=Phytoactinopolyspora mesophila TaxID=2650750 RepID=A0A7K3M1P1_9ACTN|nr:hypothetical protein [Phytoactinopolyspora mesophila]NDL57160.1 hypothetical protein [Phytoactinopolyspora mesophila]